MKRQIFVISATIGILLCAGMRCHADRVIAPSTKQAETIAQWQSLQYGMFIHFGISTFTGHEHDRGDQPSSVYAPTDLDVDQWIRVARDAGMNYAVLTAKHVPGHCLWDSKVRWKGKEYDYDVATSGNKTDVVAEFVQACEKYGLMPGLYWCLLDYRNNPVPRDPQGNRKLSEDFYQLAKDQLAELLNRYPVVQYLWLDIPRAASSEQRTELYAHIKGISPNCIVLFNHWMTPPEEPLTIAGFQDAWPTDVLNTERHPAKPGWFVPTQTWQGKVYSLGYEHCDTICQRWFWVPDDLPRPVGDLQQLYKQTLAAGGNLLLNVPPDKTGRLPEYHVKALMELREHRMELREK